MIEEKLIAIKKTLVEYATLVERMVQDSVQSLITNDKALANKVIMQEEDKANMFEVHLDEVCTTTIAQYQPRAKELRTVLMILKMNNDLERVGDLAVNIADSALYLMDKPPVKPLVDTPHMAEIVIEMVRDSIIAFIDEDAELAKKVCERDNEVDALRDQIIRELITLMLSDPNIIERSLFLMRVSRNLERIADLATNICEDVIFIVDGKVIKHHIDE